MRTSINIVSMFYLHFQAVVESVTAAFEYADIPLDVGKAVQPDMLFDRDHKFVYVMTEKKVSANSHRMNFLPLGP